MFKVKKIKKENLIENDIKWIICVETGTERYVRISLVDFL